MVTKMKEFKKFMKQIYHCQINADNVIIWSQTNLRQSDDLYQRFSSWDSFPKNPWLLPDYYQITSGLLPGRFQPFRLIPEYSQTTPCLLPSYSLVTPWLLLGYSQTTPWLLPYYSVLLLAISKLLPGYFQSTPWLLLDYSLTSPRLLPGYFQTPSRYL